MKYHKCTIKKVPTDLGEDNPKLNYTYEVYDENEKYINVALTLSSAKDFIDSGFDTNYL